MVLACESIFSRTSFDARPQNLHTFSKVNPKYIQRTCPTEQARYSFHLPFSYNLLILLARVNRASTNVKSWYLRKVTTQKITKFFQLTSFTSKRWRNSYRFITGNGIWKCKKASFSVQVESSRNKSQSFWIHEFYMDYDGGHKNIWV